jgi:hypothetical protein
MSNAITTVSALNVFAFFFLAAFALGGSKAASAVKMDRLSAVLLAVGLVCAVIGLRTMHMLG